MPYDIIKVKGGYKVAKADNHKKTFSSYPMSKEMADRQRKAIYMNSDEFRKEHKDLVGLLNKTSSVLKQEANAQSKEARMRLGKGVNVRSGRVVRRKGNVMGCGLFGDLFEDAIVEGGKKLYKFDKEHGSHLKEGVKSGFKNMISNVFRGNGIESATRFGRGFYPDVMPEYDPTDVSGWIEKERRSTGYYGRPAILGEGM